MKRWMSCGKYVALGLVMLVMGAAEPAELENPGFEAVKDAKHPMRIATWSAFGKAERSGLCPHKGEAAAKLYGNFPEKAEDNFSGVFQDHATSIGDKWTLAAFIRHNADDALRGENELQLKLEFLNEKSEAVKVQQKVVLTTSSPKDKYHHAHVTGETPKGASKVRTTIVFCQDKKNSIGAAFVDDVTFYRGEYQPPKKEDKE